MACCAMSNVLVSIARLPTDLLTKGSFGGLVIAPSTFDIAQQAICQLTFLTGPVFSTDYHKTAATAVFRFPPAKDQRGSGGVLGGGRRIFAACSKAYASLMSTGSLQSAPNNSMPTGTPAGAELVGAEKPPGNAIAGKPVPFDKTPLRST